MADAERRLSYSWLPRARGSALLEEGLSRRAVQGLAIPVESESGGNLSRGLQNEEPRPISLCMVLNIFLCSSSFTVLPTCFPGEIWERRKASRIRKLVFLLQKVVEL